MTRATQQLVADRARLMGPNILTVSGKPVHFVRGEGVWLWDADGRKYLDCYNNAPHVGHCNPRVVEAIRRQASTLNTHTRYLHDGILNYIENLTGTMDVSLDTAILTSTEAEANDIALRMAEAVTGKRGIIATDGTYHGNTALISQLSKLNIPKVGFGLEHCFRFVDAPDSYRNPDPDGTIFAGQVAEQIEGLIEDGTGFAAFVLCPYFVNEGFPDNPDGWLEPVAEVVRKAGGLLICDEVQSGFGRTGTHLWAYEKMGVVPDIIVLGKPMANGHPLGGVVAGRDIVAEFRKGYSYFNSFIGNPVSCAAAIAVLDEIATQDLQTNARVVGDHARTRLNALATKYDIIGDVRGSGLIFGAELVTDSRTKAPDNELTDRIIKAMRARRIIHSKLDRHTNTLKIHPPMPFSIENADLLFDTLDDVLSEATR